MTAFGTAIAGGIVAKASGANIGFTFSKVERVRKELIANHQNLYQTWRENAVKAYNTSHYNVASKKSSEFLTVMKKREGASNEASKFDGNLTENAKASNDGQNPQNIQKAPSKLDLVFDEIKKFVKTNGRLPKVAELEKSGMSHGYASLALNQFTVDNGPTLLKAGLINQERLNKAITLVNKNA
jgi:hypothetical protein